MKKHDKISLDSISNINEKIIDEVTDKKIALYNKGGSTAAKGRKRFIAIGSIAASFALVLSILLAIIIPIMSNPDIPVYQGMTIRKEPNSSSEVRKYNFSDSGITFLSAKHSTVDGIKFPDNSKGTPGKPSDGKPSKNPNGHHKDKDTKPEHSIKDIVAIDVLTDDEVKYYVKPEETFIIEIHIDNPKNYEIQSFTLNGQKYANYMFKDGSTMELLLLEVTAPSTLGYVEYTIDAIKYIDGTEIKDVDMSSGDKSIKAGIAYPTAPSATVTSQSISPTSIDLSIEVSDPYSRIGNNELSVYLSDGEKAVSAIPLHVGENTVTFDNLIMNKTYEYGVVTSFDLVDGRDLHKEWLITNEITTAGAFGISNTASTQSTITFEVNRIGSVGTITSISLYDTVEDKLVETGDTDTREFINLLSNHSYDLYVDFTYLSNGKEIADWIAVKGITTVAKTEPAITFSDLSITNTQINGNIHMEDADAIGKITAVELYQNGQAIRNNAAKEVRFSGLDSYTPYRVVVTYTFDLNDGGGLQTKTATHDFTTAPSLTFKSCTVANTSIVDEGQTIYLQININNPNKVVYQKIVVNGREYNVVQNSSTTTMLYCEIVNNGQFKGGNTTLTIEKVITELGGNIYTIEPTENNTASVLIFGKKPEVESIKPVVLEEGKYVERDYIFPGEQAYMKITLSEKTECRIDSFVMTEDGFFPKIYSDPIKLDDTHYVFAFSIQKYFPILILNEVRYSQGDFSRTLHTELSCQAVQIRSDKIHYISTPDDLLNMHSSGGDNYDYYELTGDIDLSGLEWHGSSFKGVFNGKGYAIKNMSYIGTATKSDEYFGLFSSADGVIENLNLENMQFIVKPEGTVSKICFGGIAAYCKGTIISNCTVDEKSFVNVNGISVGGFGGEDGTFKNCINYGTVLGYSSVGGIGISGTFVNCANYGTVSGGRSVGGIGISGTFINCVDYSASGRVDPSAVETPVNYGQITGSISENNLVGSFDEKSTITNCYDNTTVAQLNSKSFYTETLGWGEEVWSLDPPDVENGKYPTLK